jgi:hypothetical protein
MGDIWAPRVRRAAAAGAGGLAVRVNWASSANPIFERPWGNVVNVAVAAGLAADPSADPDDLLEKWLEETYVVAARSPARALYKASCGLVESFTSVGHVETTDHGRLFRSRSSADWFERVAGTLDRAQVEGQFVSAADFAARRLAMDAARDEALALVAALPDDVTVGTTGLEPVPELWRTELARGANALWHVGRATTDQLELVHVLRDMSAEGTDRQQRLLAVAEAIRRHDALWHTADPESYETLRGDEALAMLEACACERGRP